MAVSIISSQKTTVAREGVGGKDSLPSLSLKEGANVTAQKLNSLGKSPGVGPEVTTGCMCITGCDLQLTFLPSHT